MMEEDVLPGRDTARAMNNGGWRMAKGEDGSLWLRC
jgi:hypothetical protein